MQYQTLLSNLAKVKPGDLIAIDGPAGSGKSTLAKSLVKDLPDSVIIAVDDLYDGWADAFTPRLTARVIEQVLLPISKNQEFRYDIYDWHKAKFVKSNVIPRDQIYILEGVCAGHQSFRGFIDVLIWLDISDEIGLTRVLNRDGEVIRDQMVHFQQAQRSHFAQDLTEAAADYIFDGVPKTIL
jgi:uridine kinase